MSIGCTFGIHAWEGCQCSKCGKIRNEQHDWSDDCNECSVCGTTRPDAHTWDGCKCSKCGKTRNDQHDWGKNCEKCSKCGKTRDGGHDWSKDCEKCTRCGSERMDAHQWSGCKCGSCGRCKPQGTIRFVLLVTSHPIKPSTEQMAAFLMDILPEFKAQDKDTGKVGFLWVTKPMHSVDVPSLAMKTFGSHIMDSSKYTYRILHIGLKGGEAKCFVVYDGASNEAHTIAHAWDGCICQKCGKTRDVGHDWKSDCEKCSKCGKTRSNGHDWSKDFDKCALCGTELKRPCRRCGGQFPVSELAEFFNPFDGSLGSKSLCPSCLKEAMAN